MNKPIITSLSVVLVLFIFLWEREYDRYNKLAAQHKTCAANANEFAAGTFAAGLKLGYILRHKNAPKEIIEQVINEYPRPTTANKYLTQNP